MSTSPSSVIGRWISGGSPSKARIVAVDSPSERADVIQTNHSTGPDQNPCSLPAHSNNKEVVKSLSFKSIPADDSKRSRKILRMPSKLSHNPFSLAPALPLHQKEDQERILFRQSLDLKLHVCSAIGLPLTTTATKLQPKLYFQSKETLNIFPKPIYPDLSTAYASPKFMSNFSSWKGKYLQKSMTILIRVDTLEAPQLHPKTIGYAALRLCVNLQRQQPFAEDNSDNNIYFNEGEFKIPILYGGIPENLDFLTESRLLQKMPHIDGAFLIVKVSYEISNDANDTSSNNQLQMTISPRSPLSLLRKQKTSIDIPLSSVEPLSFDSRCVATILLKTLIARRAEGYTPDIPLKVSEKLIDRFQSAVALDSVDTSTMLDGLSVWIEQTFTSYEAKGMLSYVNPSFLLEYSNSVGSSIVLNKLFNMPEREELTKAAERAGSVAAMRLGITSGWDNRISYFKTVFRYLPGYVPIVQDTENRSLEDLAMADTGSSLLLIDDASVKPSLDSPEQSPSFLDDFSSTAGLKLGPFSCLLVVVTAVDILTTKKSISTRALLADSQAEGGSTSMQRLHSFVTPFSSKSSLLSDENSKALKLKGLLGIYIGHNDPKSTWWGIVPIFNKFPSLSLGPSLATPEHLSRLKEPSGYITRNTSDEMNSGSVDSIKTRASSYGPLFVNDGMHQIPLFRGTPPEELFSSPDPMSWVTNRVQQQIVKGAVHRRKTSLMRQLISPFLSFFSHGSPRKSYSSSKSSPDSQQSQQSTLSIDENSRTLAVMSRNNSLSTKEKPVKQSKKKRKKKFAGTDIYLSEGCSALVQIIDPRIKLLPTLQARKHALLDEILQIQAQVATLDEEGEIFISTENSNLKNLQQKFAYNENKFSKKRTLKAAIPDAIDSESLVQEVNLKFYQAISR